METYVLTLKGEHDSTGGLVEVRVENPPANLGEPVFSKLKARLAHAVMGVGGVTGFSYGAGFDVVSMRGTEYIADRMHFGGVAGGISTGEPLRMRVSVKPSVSVGEVAKEGRHDPCIVPRVIPVLEAMVAVVLADLWLLNRGLAGAALDGA
jgi:chorismate synthase